MKKNKSIKKSLYKLQQLALYGLEDIKNLKTGQVIYRATHYGIEKNIVVDNKIIDNSYFSVDRFLGDSLFKNQPLYLEDNNIINGGYNLYRVFVNKEDAISYSNILEKVSFFDGTPRKLNYSIQPTFGYIIEGFKQKFDFIEKYYS